MVGKFGRVSLMNNYIRFMIKVMGSISIGIIAAAFLSGIFGYNLGGYSDILLAFFVMSNYGSYRWVKANGVLNGSFTD